MTHKAWWNGPDADYRVLEIEDDSDCETCTRRHAEQFQMLVAVKCDLLSGVTCPECGRSVEIFVESQE